MPVLLCILFSSFFDESEVTIEKTRIITKKNQLSRFDREVVKDKFFSKNTKETLKEKCEEAEMIVISDYAKGTITEDLINFLQPYLNKIIVDPKPKNKNLYKNCFLIKLNDEESFDMTKISDTNERGKVLMKDLNAKIIITKGDKGMVLFSKDSFIEIPTYAKEVYDVTGAGDTVIASLALSLSSESSLTKAAIIANHAASICVSKKGTYAVSLEELKEILSEEETKITDLKTLRKTCDNERRKNKKIVWTNGCFDLMHIGHIKYLKEASKMGDILIVGLNSDASVKRLKGPERPIQSEYDRAEILSSFDFINKIIIFDEDNVSNYLKIIKPEVYIKGGDYSPNSINKEEKEAIESYGGKIEFVSLQEGKSTSDIINKIKNS